MRIITNCSHPKDLSVNDAVPKSFKNSIPLKLDQLPDVISIICRCGRNALISRHDVKDAYKNLPLSRPLQKFFVMRINGALFVNLKLCFGDATACHYFSRYVPDVLTITTTTLAGFTS